MSLPRVFPSVADHSPQGFRFYEVKKSSLDTKQRDVRFRNRIYVPKNKLLLTFYLPPNESNEQLEILGEGTHFFPKKIPLNARRLYNPLKQYQAFKTPPLDIPFRTVFHFFKMPPQAEPKVICHSLLTTDQKKTTVETLIIADKNVKVMVQQNKPRCNGIDLYFPPQIHQPNSDPIIMCDFKSWPKYPSRIADRTGNVSYINFGDKLTTFTLASLKIWFNEVRKMLSKQTSLEADDPNEIILSYLETTERSFSPNYQY